MTYYNTTKERGEKLRKYETQAKSQEGKILSWFRNRPRMEFTPWEVWTDLFNDSKVPIWSVRRAITNLTNVGGLEQTGKKRPSGPYKRASLTWRLHEEWKEPEQQRMFR